MHSFADDDPIACKDYVRSKLGLEAWKPKARSKSLITARRRLVATYDYTDRDGVLLFQVLRYDPKDFDQRGPAGSGGWISSQGDRRALYRWRDLVAYPDATLFVCEGEKDADRIASLGHCATTVANGNWKDVDVSDVAGRDVIILEHADEAGVAKALKAANILHPLAKTIRIVRLPKHEKTAKRHGKDVSDWLDVDEDNAAKLVDECFSVPLWTPAIAVVQDAQQIDNGAITQDGIARIFAIRFADRFRFCHHSGAWHEWSGTHWKKDDTALAFQFVRELGREFSEDAKQTEIKEVRRVSFAGGVERFARSDRLLAVTSDHWDRNPFLLGTPDGTVDLRTGELRPPEPDDGITKITSVVPSDRSDCPLWLKFLDQTFRSDQELIRFLQQWGGYCLTGDTREHALLFGSGAGGNGKSVWLNTHLGILGDYAAVAAMDSSWHPTTIGIRRIWPCCGVPGW